MADLLTRVQRELDERLAELRPLVDEARQLEQALAALNSNVETAGVSRFSRARRAQVAEASPAEPAPPAEPTPSSRSTSPRRSLPRSGPTLRSEPLPQQRRRGAREKDADAATDPSDAAEASARISRNQADERRRRALAIITENPGTTAGNLALLLDTSVATMGSLLKRMEREGEIERAEKGYARPKKAAATDS
jgi:hypothetical protein